MNRSDFENHSATNNSIISMDNHVESDCDMSNPSIDPLNEFIRTGMVE